MMMNTIKLMMFLLLVGISVSCDRFLDIKPKGIQIPEYYDDYLRLLNHKDMMYADAGFVSYITDDILLGDNSVPFGQFEQAQEASQNLYAFAHGPIFSGGASDAFYEKAYKRIYTFNVVINNVGTCQDATEKEKQALIAEAKVCRAFEYLSLVNVYAKHYDSVTANSDLGVPVILSEDINKVYKRNSVQAVYDQIFKDLKEALPYIPDEAATPFRASKQFLYAFTAKLYLYMGKYGDALTAALKVDQDQLQLIDLTAYSINPKANGMGRIWNEETGEVSTAFLSRHISGNIDEFLRLVSKSGDSSYKYLQNIYSTKDTANQGVSLGLMMSEIFLGYNGSYSNGAYSNGVCRVHGGGFAGTILAIVKDNAVDEYRRNMDKIFGDGASMILQIRHCGGVRII